MQHECVALSDKRYEPLWKRADELKAVIQIHPTYAIGREAMTDYWRAPAVTIGAWQGDVPCRSDR